MRFVIGVCVLLLGSAAFATTLMYRDLPELSRTSDAVVRGKVLETKSRWTSDGSRIVTDVTVEVAETLKGAPAKKVTIVQPGGQVGDLGQKVSGLATFQQGEEVVVFLEQRGPAFVVNGMAQGKFRVERSTDGKAVYAVPDPNLREAIVLDPLTRQPAHVERSTLALEQLRSDVRKALAVPRAPELAPQKKPREAR